MPLDILQTCSTAPRSLAPLEILAVRTQGGGLAADHNVQPTALACWFSRQPGPDHPPSTKTRPYRQTRIAPAPKPFVGPRFRGPFWAQIRPRKGQDKPNRASKSLNKTNIRICKIVKTLCRVFNVLGVQTPPEEAQAAEESSQEAPKNSKALDSIVGVLMCP